MLLSGFESGISRIRVTVNHQIRTLHVAILFRMCIRAYRPMLRNTRQIAVISVMYTHEECKCAHIPAQAQTLFRYPWERLPY
jgi:metal-responsive CopG/Arc/MetJ family transcriptional regulator